MSDENNMSETQTYNEPQLKFGNKKITRSTILFLLCS